MKARLIAIVILSNIISAGILSADSHEGSAAEEVLQATRNWNGSANRGEWEACFSAYAKGCTEYWETGILRSRFNGENSWVNKVESMTEWTNNGGKRSIYLRHPEVAMHGHVAIVTTYLQGWFQPPDKDRVEVLDNVTFVWKKTDDGWKIVHTHFSEIKKDMD